MNEAKIAINNIALSQGQSATLRTACINFKMTLDDPVVCSALDKVGVQHRINLDQILRIIDETVA